MITKEQIEHAYELHNQGLSWVVVASYLGVNRSTLDRYRKRYEHNNKIPRATSTS